MHTLYCGPSWGEQSFESVNGDDPIKTNLAKELGLTNYTSLALGANSSFDQLQRAKTFMRLHNELAPFRILFVTANSIQDGHKFENVSQIDFAKSFLSSSDPLAMVQDYEARFYHEIVKLEIPVALIGAHVDTHCQSHDNITVIHPSWQNFLGKLCNLRPVYGWCADVGHRWLHGHVIPEQGPPLQFVLESKPSSAVVDEIHNLFEFWHLLEIAGLFKGCHPNIKANQLFASHIQSSISHWLDQH